MFNGYHLQNRQHALKALAKPISMPARSLAVDKDEALNAMDMQIQYVNKRPTAVIPDVHTAPVTLAPVNAFSEPFDPEKQTKSFYMGEATGGI